MERPEMPLERSDFEGCDLLPASAPCDGPGQSRDATPVRLPAEALRELAKLHPFTGYRDIATEWAAIAATVCTCLALPHPLIYVAGITFIGARQHALLILMHDGAHRLLSRNALVNDLTGELFLAWPFVILHMRNYRVTHFLHHRFVNTEKDPDWAWKQAARWPWCGARDASRTESLWHFPVGKGRMAAILAVNLFFYGFWTALRRNSKSAKCERPPGETPFLAGWLVYQAVLFGTLLYHGWLLHYLAFWLVPMVTWLQLCMAVRGIAEHFSIDPGRRGYGETRTTTPSILDALFIVPRNIGYHIEHHLHPFIPYYALPECHREYCGLTAFREQAHVTKGYWGVVKECVQRN